MQIHMVGNLEINSEARYNATSHALSSIDEPSSDWDVFAM